MSRLELAFEILRSIERGDPQPTALHKLAEQAEWERRASQAETPAELERIRRLYDSRPRVY